MEARVLNYRIILEPEIDEKTGKKVYNAFCPRLGVADWGKSTESALDHIKEAIECHIRSLIKHGKPVPVGDTSEFMVATTQISIPKKWKFALG